MRSASCNALRPYDKAFECMKRTDWYPPGTLRLHLDSAATPRERARCFAFETLIDLFMATLKKRKKKIFCMAIPFL